MINLNRVILKLRSRSFNTCYCKYIHVSSISLNNEHLHKIRNIGILAHIDAGKTTTTERMLYYSGKIDHMGEVHHGNTVTDYLVQERNRGITITSASVTVPWLSHKINIIDTPGHIDFTFEVEQSLKVIDGAVVILDGSAGVEAQTVTVWRQADKYNVPRMIYVNKMDRVDSNFDFCLQSLANKFDTAFLPIQVPVKGSKTGISAIIDVINRDLLVWSGDNGDQVIRIPIEEGHEHYELAQKRRNELVEKLSDVDDEIAELVLKEDSYSIGVDSIYQALRRITLNQKGVVVLCGSSYKNIGVQKLLDAVVNILPSPETRKDLDIYKAFEGNLCASAFKVVHDKQKGPVTFFRIYSGSMKKGQRVHVVSSERNENIQRLMIALADDYEEVTEVSKGNIAATTGLKHVSSGDFVTNSGSSVSNAARELQKQKKIPYDECLNLLCPRMSVPEPVFFCSIEAPSQAWQTALDTALEQLQKEDPSLRIKTDPDTGQTIMGGMGELHLEIIKDRILTKYKIEADVGPLQIAYKEFLVNSATNSHSLSVTIGGITHAVNITLTILPKENEKDELLILDNSIENVANLKTITPKRLAVLRNGLVDGLQRGPKVSCQVANAKFILHGLQAKKMTSDSVLASAAAQCVQKLLGFTETIIMEPIMNLNIITDEERMSFVMSDLSRRRANICEFTSRGHSRIVRALVPLAELLGYSKDLRIGTSGNATFTMEFDCYKEILGKSENEVIKEITGFYPM